MTPESRIPSTIVAVDWSGAKDPGGQRKGICAAIARPEGVTSSSGLTRIEAVELIERLPEPCAVGFDFSFGFPAWFARERGCSAIGDVWTLAARDGERWLGPPPEAPFWRDKCVVPVERRFRRCETALARPGVQPSSIFMLVGAGTVGTGSVRGMPLLARLRARGFAVWPFDAPGARTVVEIYPTCLRPLAPAHLVGRAFATDHERDAVLSAAVMWEHRTSFASLAAATDPVTGIEGDVWTPPGA